MPDSGVGARAWVGLDLRPSSPSGSRSLATLIPLPLNSTMGLPTVGTYGGKLDASFAPEVTLWWSFMSAIACVNIGLWVWLGRRRHLQSSPDPRWRLYWRRQWLLSGLYVLGCASRCFVLRSDVNRFALIDSWFASVAVGRSIATLAELAFVAQWTLLLLLFARETGSKGARKYALPIVPIIFVAEIASWYGVLTTNYLGHVVEESLWAFSAGLMVLGLWRCRATAPPPFQGPLRAGLFCGVSYVAYMVTIDVPNYVRAWQADQATSKSYLHLAQGLEDIQRVVVTGRLEDWRYPMVWMTLYFSLAVWMSLAMIRWPVEMDFDQDVLGTED